MIYIYVCVEFNKLVNSQDIFKEILNSIHNDQFADFLFYAKIFFCRS